ncbi:hypothetical protein GCM10027037_14420 [Mucilaginibacter koreensis]
MNNAPLHILIAGRHPEIVPTVVRLLGNTPNWHPVGTLDNREAINYMHRQPVDILLLSSGLAIDEEKQLRCELAHTHPNAVVIQHYGGGSGLLTCEIKQAITEK